MSVLLHSFDALSSTIFYAAPPNPPAQPPPGLDTFTTKVLGWLKWGTGIAAMGGLLAVAVMMGVGIRGRSDTAKNAMSHAPWVFGAAALAGSASVLIGAVGG